MGWLCGLCPVALAVWMVQEVGDVTAASRYTPCRVDPGVQRAPAPITSLF